MYKNILIPTDGSDLATKAVEQGVRFAKEIGAKVTAMTVTEPFHLLSVAPSQLEDTPIEYKKHAQAHAENVLGTVSAAANSAGVGCETLHVEHEHVYQAIIDAAASRMCDLVVPVEQPLAKRQPGKYPSRQLFPARGAGYRESSTTFRFPDHRAFGTEGG